MSKILQGGCLCGAVRYEYSGELAAANYCHCRDCRKTTGSAFNIGVRVDKTGLRIVAGQVKSFTKIGDSGNAITRELSEIAQRILRWRDRYEPPVDQRDDGLGAYPYLGSAHEYQEKVPGSAPYLKHIHVFNPAGFVSSGLPVGDVPSIQRDVPAIVSRISHDLFFADWAHHEARITGWIAPEFEPALYASAVWQPSKTAALST